MIQPLCHPAAPLPPTCGVFVTRVAQDMVGTPANWSVGGEVVILPSVDDATAAAVFPKGFFALTPYLRITALPDEADAD